MFPDFRGAGGAGVTLAGACHEILEAGVVIIAANVAMDKNFWICAKGRLAWRNHSVSVRYPQAIGLDAFVRTKGG